MCEELGPKALIPSTRVVAATAMKGRFGSRPVEVTASAERPAVSDDRQAEVARAVEQLRLSEEARLAYRQVDVAANRFLNRSLKFYGFISEDPALREAVLTPRAIVDHMPRAAASRCFRILAAQVAGLGPIEGAGPKAIVARTRSVLHLSEVLQWA